MDPSAEKEFESVWTEIGKVRDLITRVQTTGCAFRAVEEAMNVRQDRLEETVSKLLDGFGGLRVTLVEEVSAIRKEMTSIGQALQSAAHAQERSLGHKALAILLGALLALGGYVWGRIMEPTIEHAQVDTVSPSRRIAP